MGLLAWIQNQFGIPVNMNNDRIQEATSAKSGKFKVLRIQPTPNPDAFQFILNGKIIEMGTKTFDASDDGIEDPMAKALFGIFGMQSIFIKENFITITKSDTVGWHTIMEKIGGVIETHSHYYEKGDDKNCNKDLHPVLENFNKEDFFNYNSERKVEVINALLDVAIRPALANDGGGINLISVENKTIKIHYQGACGSCPSSTTGTLQYIEQFLKEAIHSDIEVQAT